MKALAFTSAVVLMVACASDNTAASLDAAPPEDIGVDSGRACSRCDGYWICGGDVERIDLKPEVDGCYLSGLPGRNLLTPDCTIIADGVVVGEATVYGVSVVHVLYSDGGEWLYCRAAG